MPPASDINADHPAAFNDLLFANDFIYIDHAKSTTKSITKTTAAQSQIFIVTKCKNKKAVV